LKTSSTALIDTSALLAVVHPRDQHHAEAVAIGRRFVSQRGRWVGTTLVLAELHTHLLRARGAPLARKHVKELLEDHTYQWVDAPADLVHDAIAAWLERFGDQRFSLTDAVSFEVMRREKIETAFAFDRHFVTAGFELLD